MGTDPGAESRGAITGAIPQTRNSRPASWDPGLGLTSPATGRPENTAGSCRLRWQDSTLGAPRRAPSSPSCGARGPSQLGHVAPRTQPRH